MLDFRSSCIISLFSFWHLSDWGSAMQLTHQLSNLFLSVSSLSSSSTLRWSPRHEYVPPLLSCVHELSSLSFQLASSAIYTIFYILMPCRCMCLHTISLSTRLTRQSWLFNSFECTSKTTNFIACLSIHRSTLIICSLTQIVLFFLPISSNISPSIFLPCWLISDQLSWKPWNFTHI